MNPNQPAWLRAFLPACGLCLPSVFLSACAAPPATTKLAASSVRATVPVALKNAPSSTRSTQSVISAWHLEAEDGTLSGPTVAHDRKGFSGTGYVTGFQKDGDKITWDIPNAQAGIYQARIRFSAPSGPKGFDLVVNGAKSSGTLPGPNAAFSVMTSPRFELKAGANTISIEKGWGYYDIDSIDISPAKIDMSLKKVVPTPSDPKATQAVRRVMDYLASQYGTKTLSGQQDPPQVDYLQATTGKYPAVLSNDFIEYSPSRVEHGARPEGTTEKMIEYSKAGYLVSMCWHWNAPKDLERVSTDDKGVTTKEPWWSGFYTRATTFDVQKALANPNGEDYKLLVRDMDVIAAQLKKFDAAGVPVLWRPLHEAEGGWFWWGAKGPESFKQLWRLMYDRFTRVHNLHNLIWVYSSGTDPKWYPGDAYVDIAGIDQYPSDWSDPLSSVWDTLKQQHDGRKMIALSEFGGVPDVEKMRRYGVRWAYFASWTNELGPRKLPKPDLTRIYNSNVVITRDELPSAVIGSGTRSK